MSTAPPIPGSYLVPGTHIVAGHYPGDRDSDSSRVKLRALLDFGIDYFIDVTSPDDGMMPYEDMLREEAAEKGIEYHAFPIPDMGVTDATTMTRIIDAIDAALEAGHTIYVHCWGGVGRTGTVVGCYLVRHGSTGDEALGQVRKLFRTTSQSLWHPEGSPQTNEQRAFVRSWGRLDEHPVHRD